MLFDCKQQRLNIISDTIYDVNVAKPIVHMCHIDFGKKDFWDCYSGKLFQVPYAISARDFFFIKVLRKLAPQ